MSQSGGHSQWKTDGGASAEITTLNLVEAGDDLIIDTGDAAAVLSLSGDDLIVDESGGTEAAKFVARGDTIHTMEL